MNLELLVIGGGPAGLTAGIYASRLGLQALVLEKGLAGGMLREAPQIENFPGEKRITGEELAEKLKEHALQYVPVREGEEVLEVRRLPQGFEARTGRNSYQTSAVIFCTGTSRRKLGLPREEEFLGRGLSYCAICDGQLFRGKRVAVVGGGNSAIMEAIHLRELGCEVFLIHRRDELRAEKHLQGRLGGINLKLNRVVEEILGRDSVEGLRLLNTQSGEREELPVEGVFVAVGEIPNTSLAVPLGVRLREDGYISVDATQRTSVPRVYAAGDVTGGARQIVVACSQGAVAALSAFEDLKSPYWKR